MSFVHDYTPTTLLAAIYPGIILELKNPENYALVTPAKHYYDARAIFELSSPTTQCNSTVGPLLCNTICWICGAPIFLEESGNRMFDADNKNKPTDLDRMRNGNMLKAECEHVLPVVAAWWIIGSLATTKPGFTPLNAHLHKHEYRWSHRYCNRKKLDSLYFTREGTINKTILEEHLYNIWLNLKPVRLYYMEKIKNKIQNPTDFKEVQLPEMYKVLTPLVDVYKTMMIGEFSNLNILALIANISSYLRDVVESDSVPPVLRNIVRKGIGYIESPPAELRDDQQQLRGVSEHDDRPLSEIVARKMAAAVIDSLRTITSHLNCNKSSEFMGLIMAIYIKKKSNRDPAYLAFMYNVLGYTIDETIRGVEIGQKLCDILRAYILKVTPLLLQIVNDIPATYLQRQAFFLERLQIALYNNIIEKIGVIGRSADDITGVDELMQYLRVGLLETLALARRQQVAAGAGGAAVTDGEERGPAAMALGGGKRKTRHTNKHKKTFKKKKMSKVHTIKKTKRKYGERKKSRRNKKSKGKVNIRRRKYK
jgi:hypothetical protein